VSVCIPTYNYARFLPEAIESVLNQSFTDFELLIMMIVQRTTLSRSSNDTRRKTRASGSVSIHQTWAWSTIGTCACVRRGGEFIKFVFGDDLLTSRDALRKMLSPLIADRSISLVASARNLVDHESNVIRNRSSFAKNHRHCGR